MTQRLMILGPNLLDQSKGDFHVHGANCADITQPKYRGVRSEAMCGSYGRRMDVVTDVYPPDDFGYDDSVPTEVAPYAQSLYFFPCVKI